MNIRYLFFKKQIESLQKFFEQKFGIVVKIGAELEFYLRGEEQAVIDVILEELAKKCLRIELEKGWQQYEGVFDYDMPPPILAERMNEFKTLTQFIARRSGCQSSFEAKPYHEDYGSAMHLHLSLHNPTTGENLFEDTQITDNVLMGKALAGILEISPEAVYLLCRKQNDFQRFVSNYMAPTHISWGGNNRTTILRIPDAQPHFKRIEFRLPPSSADPATAIFVLLVGLLHGLSQQLKLPERIHGNAFDNQYDLPPLPKTIKDSQNIFEKGGIINYYMKKISPHLVPDFTL